LAAPEFENERAEDAKQGGGQRGSHDHLGAKNSLFQEDFPFNRLKFLRPSVRHETEIGEILHVESSSLRMPAQPH
jgi:hypothetical protein